MPAVKRSNPASFVSPTKKKCCVIEEALKKAEGAGLASLTSTVAEALAASVPFSLGLAKEERHKFQEEAVHMTGQVLEDYKASLEAGLETCRSAVAEAERRRDEFQATAQQKQSDLNGAQGVANTLKIALAETARTFQVAKAAVKEAEGLAEDGSKELKAAAEQKREVEKLQQDMENLHEKGGGLGDRQHKDFVTRCERYLEVDSSMMTAIPCVLAKQPGARGQFDLMVVQQLTEKVHQAIAKFQATIDGGVGAEAARAASVNAAKSVLQEAQQKQIEAARQFTEAATEGKKVEEMIQKTRGEITQARRALKDAFQKKEGAQFDLDLFCQEIIQTFTELRDRSAVLPEDVMDDAAAPLAATPTPALIEVA
jgi:chromosome segregation ATPase